MDFAYDGDGTRVKQIVSTYDQSTPQNITGIAITAYFMGGAYEVTTDANKVTLGTKKYYSIAGMTVAMNDGSGLQYLLTDHLGSVVAITNASGTLTSQQRYLPFGQVRTDLNGPRITNTDFSYTGQRANSYIKLLDYKSRWYSDVGRFTQPDSIVPDPSNPQSLNRYSYVLNQPINLNDPTGHDPWWCDTASCEAKYIRDNNGVIGGQGTLDKQRGDTYWRDDEARHMRGFEVGYAPKTLDERSEDIYDGKWPDLLASGRDFIKDATHNPMPNVDVYVNLHQNSDHTVNVTGVTVSNQSDDRIFMTDVKITAKWNPVFDYVFSMCHSSTECYHPNPPQIRSQSDGYYFATIEKGQSQTVSLTPSGNSFNPTNRFGPASMQSVNITVAFRFVAPPGGAFVSFNILP